MREDVSCSINALTNMAIGLARGRTGAYFKADSSHSLPASNQPLAAALPPVLPSNVPPRLTG